MHYHLKDAKTIYEQEGIQGKLLLSSDDIDYVYLTIEPHASIPAHPLHVRIDFYISSGTGRLTVGEEDLTVSSGDIISVNPGIPRGWENTSAEPLVVLGIKRKA